ncbi:hypothetical protein NQ317_008915, partial [Molorchus minor]
ELQAKLQTSASVERITKEENLKIKTKMSDIESELGTVTHKVQMLLMQLEQEKTEKTVKSTGVYKED